MCQALSGSWTSRLNFTRMRFEQDVFGDKGSMECAQHKGIGIEEIKGYRANSRVSTIFFSFGNFLAFAT